MSSSPSETRSLTHHSLNAPWNKVLITAINSDHAIVTQAFWTRDMLKTNCAELLGCDSSKEPLVSLPSGGWHMPSTSVISAALGASLPCCCVVYGMDMGLTLTLFDVSLFPLSYAVQSNALWLFNRKGWRTFFFFLCKDIWQMDSLQTGFCGISSKAISLPFSQSTVNFS